MDKNELLEGNLSKCAAKPEIHVIPRVSLSSITISLPSMLTSDVSSSQSLRLSTHTIYFISSGPIYLYSTAERRKLCQQPLSRSCHGH